MRAFTALTVTASALFLGLVAQTAIALDAKDKVYALTHQTVECDGVRVTLETDRTDAIAFAQDKCEVFEFSTRQPVADRAIKKGGRDTDR